MVLITTEQYNQLVKARSTGMKPIVKLFVDNLTWLVTGIEKGILYGYADLGFGCVEWGSLIELSKLSTIKGRFGYLERDRYWKDKKNLNYLKLETLIGV